MIICIHTVCHVRWKPSISSQFYSVFPIMPLLFTFSVSTPRRLPVQQLQESLLVRIWETPAVNKVWKQVFCSNQSRGLLMPDAPYLVVADARSQKLKCHPFSLNPGWKAETPAKRWNTSGALICSLMPAGVCTGPQRDACPPHQVFLVETSHWLNFALLPTWLCWIHCKCIQNNTVAASQFNALK